MWFTVIKKARVCDLSELSIDAKFVHSFAEISINLHVIIYL